MIQLQDTDAGAEVIHLAENGFCADGDQEALVADGALEIGGRAPGQHRRRPHRERRADRRVGAAPGARDRAAAARAGRRPAGAGQPEGRLHAALRRTRHRRRVDPVGLTWTRATRPSRPSSGASARQLARELGPATVADLDDADARASGSRPRCATRAGSSCATTGATADRSRAASKPRSSPRRSAARLPTSRSRARCSPPISPRRAGAHDDRRRGRRVSRRAHRRGGRSPAPDDRARVRGRRAATATSAYVLVPDGDGLSPRPGAPVDDGAARRRRSDARGARDSPRARRSSRSPGQRRPLDARRPRGVDRARARAHERRSRRGHARACSTSPSRTRRSGASTAFPSVRSRPCSTCSPRRTA